MCGVHNLTKNLFVYNLSALSVLGMDSAASVIINMPFLSYHEESFFKFVNVMMVKIVNLTINVPSISFKGVDCHLIIRNSNLHGYNGLSISPVSTLNITHSKASLVNCTLKCNVFIQTTAGGVLTLRNSLIEQYNHAVHSAIWVVNSTIALSGNIKFVNNNVPGPVAQSTLCGGVLRMSDSTLNIKNAASVLFIGNTASVYGGAVYMEYSHMHETSKK